MLSLTNKQLVSYYNQEHQIKQEITESGTETKEESEMEDTAKPSDLPSQNRTKNVYETNFQENSDQENEKEHCWVLTKESPTPFCKEHHCLLSNLSELPRLTCGDFVVHSEVDELEEKVREKAKRELRETEEVVRQSVEELRKRLKEEEESNGLIAPIDNEAWLLRFLRSCHFYADSAFLKVKNYYQFKIKNDRHKEIYKDLKPSNAETVFIHDIITVLPKRDQDGCRVLVLEIGKKWNYNICSVDEIYKGGVMFLEAAVLEPETQISGARLLFDMEGLDSWQMWHLTMNPSFVVRTVELLQNIAPLRIKGIHIVNEPSTFGKLLRLFTVLMGTKLKNRVHVHGSDRDSLHKYINADRLPLEYGGTCKLPRIPGPLWLEALAMMDKEYEVVNSHGYKQ